MNVLIVCIDCLRADHLTPEAMPKLHAYLGPGLRLRAQAAGTWTLPSVAAILFGIRDAWECGPVNLTGTPTIAGRLRRTHATGAFLGMPTLATHGGMWLFGGFDYTWSCSGGLWWGYYPLEGVFDQFRAWREGISQQWFAYLHLYGVHDPYLFGDAPAVLPPGAAVGLSPDVATHLRHGRFGVVMDAASGSLDVSEAAKQFLRGMYHRHCQRLDARMMPLLEQIGRRDTLTIVTADHGDAHGESNIWGHGPQEFYRIPAVLEVPLGVLPPEGEEARPVYEPTCTADLWSIIDAYLPRDAGIDREAVEAELKAMGYV